MDISTRKATYNRRSILKAGGAAFGALAVWGIAGNLPGVYEKAVAQFNGPDDFSPGYDHFLRTWQRTDKPVADGVVSRTWIWGPQPNTAPMTESYVEAPGGSRTVQYWDKARMEDNKWRDPSPPWDVTNGLLTVELVSGNRQTGDATFEQRFPTQINVAGDADDPTGPQYATFSALLGVPPRALGTTIIQRVDRAGTVTDDQGLAGQGVTVSYIDEVTNHAIAAPFWDFMNSSGIVYENGQFITAKLFENPYFATGRPITEAYWATVKVGGTYKEVLMQCFERRCLTYTPDNPPGWQVEMGNIGQHYMEWLKTTPPTPDPEPDPQPEPPTPPTAVFVLADFGYEAGGWRVENHPRKLADTNGDGRADIVAFGNDGVYVSYGQADGSFSSPQFVVANFGYNAGGWRVENHPRFVADTNADGRADIVGFGNDGVYISRAQADGSFSEPQLVLADFGYNAGGWRVENHPRFMADTTGDGRADIVGFGNDGVYVSRAQADGSYSAPQLVVADFGYNAGGWRVENHPRYMADITGDGRADIIGFGNDGVYVSRAQPDGSYSAPQFVLADFGYNAGGWRVERHLRIMADVNGDGRADIVAFGDAGVYVALAQADGAFSAPQFVLADFGYNAGGWRVEMHPRIMADVNGDGRADIVAFGNDGVYVAYGQADGSFSAPQFILADYGHEAGGWRVEMHPRLLADVTGDGRADIVGFGNQGVFTTVMR